MKNKIEYSDSLLKKLILNYKYENSTAEEKDKIKNMVRNILNNLKYEKEQVKKSINIFAPIPAFSFAAVTIIFLTILFFYNNYNVYNQTMFYSEYNNDSSKFFLITKDMEINSEDNSIFIQTSNVLYLLDKQGTIEVKRKSNLFNIGSQIKSSCYLKSGNTFVNSDKTISNKKILISTDYGNVKGAESKFGIFVSEDKMIINCFDSNVMLNKYEFDSGFYCTPLFVGDNVILTNLAKKIINFSIRELEINWEHKNEERFISASIVKSNDDKFIAVKDENYRINIYNLENGNLIYKIDSDKESLYNYVGHNLYVYNNTRIYIFDKFGKNISNKTVKEKINGLFSYKDKIYLIYGKYIKMQNKELEELETIITKENRIFNIVDDKLFQLSEDNYLTKYKL